LTILIWLVRLEAKLKPFFLLKGGDIIEKSEKKSNYQFVDYDKYIDYDFSILTNRQREILLLKISGCTFSEIGNILDCSVKTIANILGQAIKKLDGVPVSDAERKRNQQIQKKSYEKNRQKRIEDMRERNRLYYVKNRDRILSKQKLACRKSDSKNLRWNLIDPDGISYQVVNLSGWARKNYELFGLSSPSQYKNVVDGLGAVRNGRCASYKGWRSSYLISDKSNV
jgi:hypothetical protein